MQDFEQMIRELRTLVPFKSTTVPGDLVLVAGQNQKMLVYALVTDILRDQSRKDEWWHLSLQLLSVPPQQVTWTLRTPQYTGREIFTMGGAPHFLQAVSLPGHPPTPVPEGPGHASGRSGLRLVKG